jgi:hypothetical protein
MTKTHWSDRIVAGDLPYWYPQMPLFLAFERLSGILQGGGVLIVVLWSSPIVWVGWRRRGSGAAGHEY